MKRLKWHIDKKLFRKHDWSRTFLSGTIKDQLIELGVQLLQNFIYHRIHRYGDGSLTVSWDQLGGRELSDPNTRKMAECLQNMGDELDSSRLKKMISNPVIEPTADVFLKVAREIFSDGRFNWGRVVALFYFACQLVVKVLLMNRPDLIRSIITWTANYMEEHVINWIREQGGWDGVWSHFGTPTWQTVCIFLAGVLTALMVTRKM